MRSRQYRYYRAPQLQGIVSSKQKTRKDLNNSRKSKYSYVPTNIERRNSTAHNTKHTSNFHCYKSILISPKRSTTDRTAFDAMVLKSKSASAAASSNKKLTTQKSQDPTTPQLTDSHSDAIVQKGKSTSTTAGIKDKERKRTKRGGLQRKQCIRTAEVWVC